MNAFATFYSKHIYKENAVGRLKQIDFLMADVMGQITGSASPTIWNGLLDQKDELEKERSAIVDSLTRLHNG